jgi:signal transduction histidine kinase
MLLLLMHLLRMELTGHSDSAGRRLRGALIFISLFLVIRALFFAGDLYRYSTTIDRLERAETDVRARLETERLMAQKLTDKLETDLRACRFEDLMDPHRSLRCLERLSDRNRLEYRFSGVLLADPSGRIIRGVGLGRGWSHLSEMGLENGGAEEPILIGDNPVFATESSSCLVAGQDTLRLFLLTSLLNTVPNALVDATGFSAHILVDGKTMAWGGAGPRPYNSLRPWLGIVQPSREMLFGGSLKQHRLTVLLAKEDFERPYSQWLDLVAVLIIPCIYLFISRWRGEQGKVRLKYWWIITFAALYLIAALLLHQGRLDTGPVPAAGRMLEVLLHMAGITGVVVSLDRIVTSRRSRRLNFALLGSYLFVSLIPLAVIMIVGGNIFLSIQRGVVEKTIEGLEKRADNMVLAYMGNGNFTSQLLLEGPALFELSTETSWLNFIRENQYLFTYDLPNAYITLWARDREDHNRFFTGYSYTAPRTGKLYYTRPGWTGDQNVMGLFLDNGTAVIRAMRMYRYREFEMDIVSHIPVDDRIIRGMEDRLRVVPFMPRFHLEPAWLESTDERSRPEGWYIPYSSELVLQARGWQSGRPRWVIYRASMYIPAGEEMLRILVPVMLLIILPFGLSLWGAYTTFKRTARPLTRLLTGIRRVGQGDLEYRLGESGESEIGLAAHSFDAMASNLQEMIGELAEKKKVEEVSEMKSNFISMVSHDLKTPLASIRGAAENVLEEVTGPVNERQRTYLEMILKSSGDLQRMITDLLDLSRIESGRLRLNMEPLDIRREAEDLLHSIEPILEKEGMTGRMTVSAESTIVRGDRVRVWQILNNIVSNAVRHSPEEGTIEIRIEDIPIDETDGRRMVRISVRDEGPGISEEGAAQLFEPFFYRSSAMTGAHGAGLGLAIVKTLVELHGGSVSIRNSADGGAVFSFTLPA